jgi:hypothetical protein
MKNISPLDEFRALVAETDRLIAEHRAAIARVAAAKQQEEARRQQQRSEHERAETSRRNAEEAKRVRHETGHAQKIMKAGSLRQLNDTKDHVNSLSANDPHRCRFCRDDRGANENAVQAHWRSLPEVTDQEATEPRSNDPYWDGLWKLSSEERNWKLLGANPGQKLEYQRMIREQQEAVQRIIIMKEKEAKS